MPSAVHHPEHYNQHPSGVECIDVVEHMSFNLGNAIKYLWRADLKGDPVEDLRKAAWYVNREIERRTTEEAAALRSAPVANDDQHGDYCGQEHPPTENCIGPGFECGYCGAPPAVRPEDLDHTPGSSRPCTECAPDAGHNAGRPISQVHCDACGGWGHHTPSCPI